MLTHSFEDLAQTFRILAESNLRFHQLIEVDRPEAVGTIETALNATLNAFHNLYDLMQKQSANMLDWYATPELCIILAIRNARHHNNANRIRSIYNLHHQVSENPTDTKSYLYVDFPANPDEEGGDFFDVPLSWGDIEMFLSLPRNDSRLRAGTRELVRNYLNADAFEQEAVTASLDNDDICINIVPLLFNAGKALLPSIKNHVTPNSIESGAFLDLFGTIGAPLIQQHEYNRWRFSLPK